MEPNLLRRDCARCAGLCCVALAFDRSALFAFDKPAGTPCSHLTSRHRCRIHATLEERGFAGCAAYDCLGAGQRVTQELFAGRSWQDEPALAESMFDAFRALREVHELLLLLHTARSLPLTVANEKRRAELSARLTPLGGWSTATLAELEASTISEEVRHFLRSLRAAPRLRRKRRAG
jgi:hypothetical protein